MKADEFVSKLKIIQPPRESFESNLSEELIESVRSSYSLKHISDVYKGKDELLRLVMNYDASNLGVAGEIVFFDEVKEDDKYIYFAKIELDPLVIDKTDEGIIKYIEYPHYDHIYCECALNSEFFLDVIYELKAFVYRIQCNKGDIDPCRWAKKLSIFAGMPSSLNFYKTILSCED